MSERIELDIKVERKGTLYSPDLQIARTRIQLIDGRAKVRAKRAHAYWLYFFIEGKAGASAELIITDPDGNELLKIEHKTMEIPPLLGKNGGSFRFEVP
jgi:hypothetical protein